MFGINVGQIVQGHINEMMKREQDLSKERLAICKECPLYTNTSFGPICDSKKCYNVTLNHVKSYLDDGYVCGCGCRLKAKSTLVNAQCVLNKW